MATSAKINRNTSCALAVIAVRLLDDAHMTWVAAEVESKHALRAWLTRARRKVRAGTWHTAQRSTAKRQQPATCSGFLS
jgi:hypothetical protein